MATVASEGDHALPALCPFNTQRPRVDTLLPSEFLPKPFALLGMAFQFHLSDTTSFFTFSSKTSYVFLCDSQIPLLHSRALNWCFCYEDHKFWVNYVSFISLSVSLKEYYNPWNRDVSYDSQNSTRGFCMRRICKTGLSIPKKPLFFSARNTWCPAQFGCQPITCMSWETWVINVPRLQLGLSLHYRAIGIYIFIASKNSTEKWMNMLHKLAYSSDHLTIWKMWRRWVRSQRTPGWRRWKRATALEWW